MTEALPRGATGTYLRFVALGDSATCGIGDSVNGELRGWSRILVDSLRGDHVVSFCNLAVAGSTIDDVWRSQIDQAIAHAPAFASLIVGLNDTFRTDWDPPRARERLLELARRLDGAGARLLTVCFHDHARVFGLPRVLRRPLSRRIDQLNAIYEEIHAEFDTIHVDLRHEPAVYRRDFWTIDRLHPSELGHRFLARRFADALRQHGLQVAEPSLDCDGDTPSAAGQVRWLAQACVPWLWQRLSDWAGLAVQHPRHHADSPSPALQPTAAVPVRSPS